MILNNTRFPDTIRLTKQRKVILDIVRSTTSHPTANWILLQATKILGDISKSTIYRNLKVLCDNNLLLKIDIGNGETRFDASTHDHVHLICNVCGKIVDMPDEKTKVNTTRISEITGYRIDAVDLKIHGVCPSCIDKS